MQFECIFNSHKLCYARHTKVTEPTEGLKIRGGGASSNEAGIICPSWLEGVNRFAKIWRGGGGKCSPCPRILSAPSDIGMTACRPVTFFYNFVFWAQRKKIIWFFTLTSICHRPLMQVGILKKLVPNWWPVCDLTFF